MSEPTRALLGPRIEELPKSTLPAGLAKSGGQYPFFCSSPDVKSCDRWLLDAPAILMGTGGVATVHLGQGQFAYSTDTWAFRPSGKRTNVSFLFRQLEHLLPKIDHLGFEGSGLRHLQKSFIRNLRLLLPDEDQQGKIVEVLDTLDAAIRGTEAVVAKLRAMKQGLLHDLLTRGIDANGDLRPPQPEAPDLYHQTLLGWLPKEWGVSLLGEQLIGGPRNGFSPQDAGRETGVKMLGLGCLSEDGFEPRQLKNAPASVLTHPARLHEGDILISRSNTMAMVGRVGIYRDVGKPCIYPDLMMRLVPSASYLPQFMEIVLRSSSTRRQIQNAAVGTSGSMVKINSRSVRAFLIPKVSMSEQESILDTLMKLTTKLQRERTYLDKLRLQKSGLMDDLLTGRVPVTPLL